MRFNIFELLAFIFNCALAYFVGRYLGDKWGLLGWILGAPLGFGTGIIVLKTVFGLPAHVWHKFRPLRPTCRKGVCQAQDYELLKATSEGSTFQCKCGDKYFRLGTTGRFLEVLPDGSLRPYMKRKPFGKWEPDADQPPHLTVLLAKP
jgi:hypothetical protein